ncbi:glutamate 5-kinase [Saxibacter everestensis]|uniref:Glutamate 5-kinase n=1 Tax=Saxibacter everestensis TaxID=2909229 RepID=A0ABY8QZT1_9MICO|nr:glutamate 5-kinase [Brevibacteriaceae bacterium ZFBP1038]
MTETIHSEDTATALLDVQRSIAGAKRVVVKVGSSSLTTTAGGIDVARLMALTNVLAAQNKAGREVVLVSSGAIAAGLAPLGWAKRPSDLSSQQAAASVGQGLLMARYSEALGGRSVLSSQVLLSADDLIRRTHYRNAQRALERLLGMGVLPIVNENDTVATHEIRFGDNDRLAALVAHLVHAEALVLLSDVDALYTAPPTHSSAERVSLVRSPSELDVVKVGGTGTAGIGTGGMATKIEAAQIAAASGIPAVVTSAGNVENAMTGADVGTWFTVTHRRRSTRLLWLAHLAETRGRVTIDDGAVRALRDRHTSLLPAGVTGVTGDFEPGDPVEIVSHSGEIIARGLVNYSALELPEMFGRSTRELGESLGRDYEREVIHRDDLVILG